MRIGLFYHTLVSDWNHGNAHFLRGVATEMISRGHTVQVFEPENSWSRARLLSEYGDKPIRQFHQTYPLLESTPYNLETLDLDQALSGLDLVIVHEWSAHSLVRRLGQHRIRRGHFKLLFHDTHHRMVTDRGSMDAYDLANFDGVLAYGKVLADLYRKTARVKRVWTWHEAADTRVFKPLPRQPREGDLVWIGNWGDDERTRELYEFLVEPVKSLKVKARLYGVRYPNQAQMALADAGIEYGEWIPNFDVPKVFSAFHFTVHVPRNPYVRALPGIPTIRPFEALACGIPLICSPWEDVENLFTPGRDFLIAQDSREMQEHMRALMKDEKLAQSLAEHGLQTIHRRHTCRHRVDELLQIHSELTSA